MKDIKRGRRRDRDIVSVECKDRKQRKRDKNKHSVTDRQIERQRGERKRETQRCVHRKREK